MLSLAATSFVSYSLEDDLSIMMNNFTATHNILLSVIEACPKCRVYFAGSSEILGMLMFLHKMKNKL